MKTSDKEFNSLDREYRLWKFMTRKEEVAFHNEVLDRVINNPRFYLDNLNSLDVYIWSGTNQDCIRKTKKRKLYK
jgi:hypothetical protein